LACQRIATAGERGRSFATLKVAEDEHSSICNGLSTEEFLPGLLPKP